MTPARWRDVTRVYAAVVGRDPAARGEALLAACGNDEELRREVEALLAEDAGATILDRRLSETAAAVGLGDLTGRLLGPYRLEAPIGAGGMGQVYPPTDTRLQRTVAIKILPAELSTDPQFRARFDGEAKAIAALNNPRICKRYDNTLVVPGLFGRCERGCWRDRDRQLAELLRRGQVSGLTDDSYGF